MMLGLLVILVSHRHGARRWSRRWRILGGRFHLRCRIWLDNTCVNSSVSIISNSYFRLFVVSGPIGILYTYLLFHYWPRMACQMVDCSFFPETQNDHVLCWMDSSNPSIRISLSKYVSYTLSHRSNLFRRALTYSVNHLLLRWFWKMHHVGVCLGNNVICGVDLQEIVNSFAVGSDRTFLWALLWRRT